MKRRPGMNGGRAALLKMAVPALAVLALAGAGLWAYQFWGGGSPFGQAKSAVKKALPNPEGARFSHLIKGPGPGQVCGLVNARNAAGQYAGDTPFLHMAAEGKTYVVHMPTEDEFRTLWQSLQNKGDASGFGQLADRCDAAVIVARQCGTPRASDIPVLCKKTRESIDALLKAMRESFGRKR